MIEGSLQTTYDADVDAAYIYIGSGTIAETEQVRPNVLIDLTTDGHIVGIEILAASTTLSPAFVERMLARDAAE